MIIGYELLENKKNRKRRTIIELHSTSIYDKSQSWHLRVMCSLVSSLQLRCQPAVRSKFQTLVQPSKKTRHPHQSWPSNFDSSATKKLMLPNSITCCACLSQCLKFNVTFVSFLDSDATTATKSIFSQMKKTYQ